MCLQAHSTISGGIKLQKSGKKVEDSGKIAEGCLAIYLIADCLLSHEFEQQGDTKAWEGGAGGEESFSARGEEEKARGGEES